MDLTGRTAEEIIDRIRRLQVCIKGAENDIDRYRLVMGWMIRVLTDSHNYTLRTLEERLGISHQTLWRRQVKSSTQQ